MDEAFVSLMKDYIELSMQDRKENKAVLKETRNCLTSIKVQLAKLETQSISDETFRTEQKAACDKKHESISLDLKRIPTEKEKKNLEDRVIGLEKLKPFIYKMMVIVSILGVLALPLLKKAGYI